MIRASAVITCLLVLYGCAAADYSKAPSSKVASDITVRDSSFDKEVTYIGPVIRKYEWGQDIDRLWLVAARNKTNNNMTYFVSVEVSYDGDLRLYESADFSDAARAITYATDRKVTSCTSVSCSHKESLNILLPFSRLKDRNDISIRINGKRADKLITIPGTYIDGFLSGVGSRVAAGR